MVDFIKKIKDSLGFTKTWQWVYRSENSFLWEITPFFMEKKQFEDYISDYNSKHKIKIVEYRKVKLSKKYKPSTNIEG